MTKKRLFLINGILGSVAVIFITLFFIFSTNRLSAIYAENTSKSIYDQKKIFLHDTVNNFVQKIESNTTFLIDTYEDQLQRTVSLLTIHYQEDSAHFPDFIEQYAIHYLEPEGYVVLMRDPATSSLLHVTDSTILYSQWQDYLTNQGPYPVQTEQTFGSYTLFLGLPQTRIDDLVQEAAYIDIHQQVYTDENTYMWVNHLLNPAGGDGYAVRLIHPNPVSSEGMILSTSMLDAANEKFPYLMELNGVLENEEGFFFTYSFRKKVSEQIAEKLTYSFFYERFDWIIAMGIYVDDTDAYILAINALSQELFLQVLLLFFGFVVLIMGSAWTINNWVQYVSISRLRAGFETKMAHDSLTEVYSRAAGEDILKRYFELYRRTKESPAIFVFDIDNFKQINDTHGHVVGDMVLKETAKLVKSLVRNTDIIYRFGGDEFILIIDGLKPENTLLVGDNVVKNVAQKLAATLAMDGIITISMGATYFVPSDHTPSDAIARADKALYQAKSEGKNTARVI